MRKISCLALLICAMDFHLGVRASESSRRNDQAYTVVERGQNHRVLTRVTWQTNLLGKVIARTNSYTELETGMHYRVNGEWVESKEEITITADGAAATNGAHTVKFAANLNSTNAVDFLTPDGQRLRSRILGLAYYDSESGQLVLIAQTKDAIGELHPPNRAIYPDAFSGLEADIEYIYTKAGFEQNVVLREQLPSPDKWNLNPDTTRLQVLTEFFNPPPPEKVVATKTGVTTDETLRFGQMRMGQGKAFAVGDEATSTNAMVVDKRWLNLESGRTVLVEEVKFAALEEKIQLLPANKTTASIRRQRSGRRQTLMAALDKVLPKQIAKRSQGEMRLAKADSNLRSGFVLDYCMAKAATNFTFKGDTTYLVTNIVYLDGMTTFEGGSVIKYATNASLSFITGGNGIGVVSAAGQYRPVILTSMDDNTVGEVIAGSSGSPTNLYANPALAFVGTTPEALHNFRISHAKVAVGIQSDYYFFPFYDLQATHCGTVFDSQCAFVQVYNALLYDVSGTCFVGSEFTLDLQHVTADRCGGLANISTLPNEPFYTLTNCLFVDITNWGNIAFVTNQTVVSSGGGPFQTVGTGAHYLATNSPYRNAGTTNIDTTLAADLKKKTTYPPIVYAQQILPTNAVFSPQAQRDTDLPDLGYHYDPLDYAFGGAAPGLTAAFTPGTAIATFSTNQYTYGLALLYGSKLYSEGTPTSPNWIVRYNMVQEQANLNWTNHYGHVIAMGDFSGGPSPAEVSCRFTKWSSAADGNYTFQDPGSHMMNLRFQDCEFYGGKFEITGVNIGVTNCLLYRVYLTLWDLNSPGNMMVQNCTFYGGTVDAWHSQTGDFMIQNSLFDHTQALQYDPLSVEYNGYITGSTQFTNDAHAVVANLSFQRGPLGDFYQPTNSAFIGAGNPGNAALVGLYHYTVTTNLVGGLQVKEANSAVDIGYHYVALNSANSPIDSDSDGLADYYEDTDGNGTYGSSADFGNWNNPDTDGDNINDGDEVFVYHTGVKNTDSDGDGISDGSEVIFHLNPASQDSNGDGVIDQPFNVLTTRPRNNAPLP